ncbi:MAG TPA: hypothetical protein VGQ00_03755 [Candidatus Norongarragalinales archaeon]|jgi:hypothetical protein|nr:hypothetical protein [Candidatus Norongarragalinales archaeon]
MADVYSIGFGVLAIVLQVVAAWYAYRILKHMGAARFWILVIIALLIMGIRRLTALLIETGSLPAFSGTLALFDRSILPFLISVFLVLGLYELDKKLKAHL